MRISQTLFTTALAVIFSSSGVLAQSASDKATAAAITCLGIGDPAERLACLESATREIAATRVRLETVEEASEAETASAPVIANENATDEELFGAEALSSTKEAKRQENKKLRLEAKVVEFRIDPYKKLTVVLDNGQVWRQLAGDGVIIHLANSDKLFTVTIKRGAIGSYRMKINELSRWIRVRRIT